MMRCRYCGNWAGILRRAHPECHERHENAVHAIPRFFSQVLNSSMPPERFGELLQVAARQSYVRADELASLSAAGLNRIFDEVLDKHPLNENDARRAVKLAEALADICRGEPKLDERLTKIGVISELHEGKLPNVVSVAGPLSPVFGKHETILWIFNYARSYVLTGAGKLQTGISVNPAMDEDKPYLSPSDLRNEHVPQGQFRNPATGDLVFTDKNVHFLESEEKAISIPLARIRRMRVFAEGIHVAARPEEPPRFFGTDDAWFAANFLIHLVRMEAIERGRAGALFVL